jgi:hypothetical protein
MNMVKKNIGCKEANSRYHHSNYSGSQHVKSVSPGGFTQQGIKEKKVLRESFPF